ncbi:MAG: hypothetical protein D6755_04265 [Anaerolineae bacterium]|nr:MAG: hypothetical protein D6755_04265 [Anaerolineae bacterium]
MSTGKLLAYIAAAILIFFGVLFIWATFSPQGRIGWLFTGLISVGIGFGLIYLAGRRASENNHETPQINLDLPGEINLQTLQCRNCGGTLSPEHITMVAGAPVVTCPYCGTSYQLNEEPKW